MEILPLYYKNLRKEALYKVQYILVGYYFNISGGRCVRTIAELAILPLRLMHRHNPIVRHTPNLMEYIVLFDIDIDLEDKSNFGSIETTHQYVLVDSKKCHNITEIVFDVLIELVID